MQDFPKNQPACSVFEEYFYFLKRQPLNPTKQGSTVQDIRSKYLFKKSVNVGQSCISSVISCF